MKDLIKTSAKYHKAFEDSIGIKERQRVDTSKYISSN